MHLTSLWTFIKLYIYDLCTFLYKCETPVERKNIYVLSLSLCHTHHKRKQEKISAVFGIVGVGDGIDGKDLGRCMERLQREGSMPCFKLGGGYIFFISDAYQQKSSFTYSIFNSSNSKIKKLVKTFTYMVSKKISLPTLPSDTALKSDSKHWEAKGVISLVWVSHQCCDAVVSHHFVFFTWVYK